MENVNLGSFIRNKRLKKRLSLKDVANATGITCSYLNRIEQGNRTNPSALVIRKLSDFYGIDERVIIRLATESHCLSPKEELIIYDKKVQTLMSSLINRIVILLLQDNNIND